jgi:hypothetical protein
VNEGSHVLAGGCVPVGEGALPYAPIVEALRPLPAELDADAVRELAGPSWPELARLLPSLGEPPGGRPGPAAQTRLSELLLGLLGRLSEETPLLLVVEDVHWADRSTRDLLAFLVRNLRRERLLVVVSYRSDEPGTDWLGPYLAVLDRSGRTQRVELPRLDRAETLAQLVGILRAAPPGELVDAVFGRSDGNPLFTEELLGAIRAGSGELPPTLRDLLRGRVQALPELARQVLAVVAVAGRRVPHWLLAAVAGLEVQPLVQALRAAVADQLLVTRPGEDGYELRHALLAEVIEADLLPGERARLHAAYARALTQRPELADASPAVAAAEVAVHWDAAREWAQALPARVRAGLAAERPAPLPRPTTTTSGPSRCGSGCPSRASRAGLTGSVCWPGRPRRPPSSARLRGPSGCWSEPWMAWIGRWSLSVPPSCWGSSASTAHWPGERLMRWPPSRRPSGCSMGGRRRPSAPVYWPVTPGRCH